MIGQILWPIVVAYAVWRLGNIAERFAPPAPQKSPDLVQVPEDLIAWALQETEPWAQEEHLQLAREKYLQLGEDWNRVRHALGLGAIV